MNNSFEFILKSLRYFLLRKNRKNVEVKIQCRKPDDVIDEYGADTLRMYEMFLGPIELSKPWSTQGINGVFGFLERCGGHFIMKKDLCYVMKKPHHKS